MLDDAARFVALNGLDPSLDVSSLVDGSRVHRSVYVDPRIFDTEMQRIFTRTWIYVGHDSEIARPGDFKSTWMGTEPVILTRHADLKPRVLVNRCAHRGSSVCQLAKGSTSTFRCNYHGWTFGLDGALLGVPFPDGYPNLDKSAMSLSAPARVESYRGFIFASFNAAVPALTDHLANALPYIDDFVDYAGDYELRVAPDSNELLYNGNWKLQLENNADGYHLNFTHQSLFEVLQRRSGGQSRYLTAATDAATRTVALANGHALMDLRSVTPEILASRLSMLPGAPPADANLDEYFGVEQAEKLYLASTGPSINLAIFPNLNLGSINICEIHPLAVDRTRVVLRPLLLADAPDLINCARLRYHEMGSGPAGFVQPDDLEMFERVSRGMTAQEVEWVDLSRGQVRELCPCPDRREGQATDETPQRGHYRQWLQLMMAER